MNLVIDQLQTRRGRFLAGPVSARLATGDCLALMGANGAGKTTLLETLAGFLAADAGRVLLDGADLTTQVPERRRFAYLPQDLALFPHLDVTQNVAFATPRRRTANADAAVAALIEQFDLGPIARLFPRQLSHGQAQRVALARALAADPVLLLLDEPTASLDVPGHQSFDAHLRKLLRTRSLAVIYATHDVLDTLSLASGLIVLDHGHVVQAGTPATLFGAPASPYVAELLGITNVWPVQVVAQAADWVRVRAGTCELVSTRVEPPPRVGYAAIGPGELEVLQTQPADPANCFEVVVESLQVNGLVAVVGLVGRLGRLHAALAPWRATGIATGHRLWVQVPTDRLRLMAPADADTPSPANAVIAGS